ncbi:MAG: T9SS type A sorting domain-containing protein [Paludibacteraceae bacterium]
MPATNPTASTRTATVTVSATGAVAKIITITQAAGVLTEIETRHKETLTLMPNIVTNGFLINVGEQKSNISVYDVSGNSVLEKQISGKNYIDIASLPIGSVCGESQ